MPSRAQRDFQIIGDDDTVEADAEAEEQILAAFATTRAREKTEVAEVEIMRYQGIPQRDAGGKLERDGNGKTKLGPLVLYFRRLEPGTLLNMRNEYTVRTPVRRAGRTQYEDKFDDEGFALHIAYIGMLPWCRQMYFDNQSLWGEEPVGTGEEFLRRRLNLGELGYCLEAVQQLEGLGEEQREQLGKSSNKADS
jgi:hypothetical protein